MADDAIDPPAPKPKLPRKQKLSPEEIMAVTLAREAMPIPEDPTFGGTLCGRRTRNKTTKYPTCHQPAGHRTDHVGQGPCRLHGGGTTSHGYKSTIKRERIAELVAQFSDLGNPLDTLPEIALARAMLVDFVERYDVWREGLLAWHASWLLTRRPLPDDLTHAFGNVIDEYELHLRDAEMEPTPKQEADMVAARQFVKYLRGEEPAVRPREILDVAAVVPMIEAVTRMVERVEKARAENAISRKDLNRLIGDMGKVVMRCVPDADALAKVREGWMELKL